MLVMMLNDLLLTKKTKRNCCLFGILAENEIAQLVLLSCCCCSKGLVVAENADMRTGGICSFSQNLGAVMVEWEFSCTPVQSMCGHRHSCTKRIGGLN